MKLPMILEQKCRIKKRKMMSLKKAIKCAYMVSKIIFFCVI